MHLYLDQGWFACSWHERNITFHCYMDLFLQTQFQNKVVKSRQDEYERMRVERDAQINEILRARQEERETKRKMLFYLSVEEERLKKLKEEEEARKLIGTSFYHTTSWFMQYFGKVFMQVLVVYILLSSGGHFGQPQQYGCSSQIVGLAISRFHAHIYNFVLYQY